MSDHFVQIYQQDAERYQQLIAAEDADGNLGQALSLISDFSKKDILDLGSGTGRIAQLLDSRYANLTSLDLHAAMLREQQRQMSATSQNSPLIQGDILQLPFAPHSFDIVIAGWAIGHFVAWYAEHWQSQIEKALAQMQRAARPGATLIILETMTTGALSPAPPTPGLAKYYELLENKHAFIPQIIATDYRFDNLARAEELIGFFFGSELADTVRQNEWLCVPEWTGIWHKQLD